MKNKNSKRAFTRMIESQGKLKVFRLGKKREDGDGYEGGDELPDGQYYLSVPADDAAELNINVKDGEVCIGPFATADDAQDAGGDLQVVNDEGTPVMDTTTEARRKKREQALRNRVNNMIREASNDLDIDTDVAGADLSNTSGAGNLRTSDTDNGVVNPPVDDPGTLNNETDPQADVPQSGTDTPNPVPVPDASIMDPTLVANGNADITENWDSYQGAFVMVKERTGQAGKVDSGLVEKADSKTVTVNGVKYERAKYTIIKIA